MKKVIFLCLFIGVSFFAYSQDTVYVQGYYIQRFLKNEILFKLKNEALRNRGKSYTKMIDYTQQLFFFPLKINAKISLWEREAIGNFLLSNQNYQHVEVFDFPPFDEYLKSYFDTTGIPIQKVEFPSQCNYYVNGNDSIYLYKIYYIEGNALRVEVENDYLYPREIFETKIKWNFRVQINRSIPSFYAYLFYKCDAIKCDIPPEGFSEWKTEDNKFSKPD